MAVWSTTRVIEITENRRIDSEFFHPVYLSTEEVVNSYETIQTLGKLGQFLIGPFGSAFHVNNYDPNSKYRYVRGKDVKPFSLKDDDNVYMPEKDYKRLIKYALAKDDLLISVVGTLGNVAIVPEGFEGIFSCKSTVFRNSKVDPYYLLAYFNSKYGRLCLLRRQRGAVQTGLNKEDLKTVPVPLVKETVQKEIGEKIRRSLQLSQQSKSLYSQATQLLNEALGINNIQFKNEKSYKASFSEVIANNRADAEFYDTKYNPYLEKINVFEAGTVPLLQCCERVTPNYNPKTERLNEIFYIEIGDISIADGAFQFKKIKTKEAPANAKIALKGGEILLSMVRPTRGAITIVPDDLPEGRVVCSGAFYVFNPKSPENREIIWLYLRLLKHCFEKYCGGTSYPTIEPKYISFFPIPQFDLVVANEIKKLITDSTDARNKSELLLEQAKNEVETLIEQAASQS